MALRPDYEVEIGTLVLHGFPARSAHDVATAFGSEIERLLAAAPGTHAFRSADMLTASAHAPVASDRPQRAGVHAAQALVRGIRP